MPRAHSAIRICLLLAGALALSGSARAQSSVSTAAVQRCADITRGTERLDCYDALLRVPAFLAPAQSRAPESPAEPTRAVVSDVEGFGSELIEDDERDVPQQIQSRLVGEFTGWRGNTEFRLENGQVWRQAGEGRLVYNANAPLITIRRGAFSAYRLSVEGVKSSVTVRRVR